MSKTIEKYSFGIGDRFARQGKAQLAHQGFERRRFGHAVHSPA